MLKHRLKSLEVFNKTPLPNWGPTLEELDFNEIVYYARGEKKEGGYAKSRDDVDPAIKAKFEKL
jgi:Fe-S cluster assembly protein SufB